MEGDRDSEEMEMVREMEIEMQRFGNGDSVENGDRGGIKEIYRKMKKYIDATSVLDPEPEPDGSETFGRIQIRSGTERSVSVSDSNPDQ